MTLHDKELELREGIKLEIDTFVDIHKNIKCVDGKLFNESKDRLLTLFFDLFLVLAEEDQVNFKHELNAKNEKEFNYIFAKIIMLAANIPIFFRLDELGNVKEEDRDAFRLHLEELAEDIGIDTNILVDFDTKIYFAINVVTKDLKKFLGQIKKHGLDKALKHWNGCLDKARGG